MQGYRKIEFKKFVNRPYKIVRTAFGKEHFEERLNYYDKNGFDVDSWQLSTKSALGVPYTIYHIIFIKRPIYRWIKPFVFCPEAFYEVVNI